jgi:hypothetical protein
MRVKTDPSAPIMRYPFLRKLSLKNSTPHGIGNRYPLSWCRTLCYLLSDGAVLDFALNELYR